MLCSSELERIAEQTEIVHKVQASLSSMSDPETNAKSSRLRIEVTCDPTNIEAVESLMRQISATLCGRNDIAVAARTSGFYGISCAHNYDNHDKYVSVIDFT